MRLSRIAMLSAIGVAAALLLEATAAQAQCPPFPTILSTCSAAKKKCAGKKAAGLLACHAKAQRKNLDPATDPAVVACIAKHEAKFTACYAKLDARQDPAQPATLCPAGGGDAAVVEAKVDAFVDDVVCALTTTAACPPIPTILSTCSAGKEACAGKKAEGLLGCHAKAQTKNLDPNTDPLVTACVAKVTAKFSACYVKLDAKQDPAKPASVCPSGGNDAAAIEATVDAFVADVACALSLPPGPTPTPLPTATATPSPQPTPESFCCALGNICWHAPAASPADCTSSGGTVYATGFCDAVTGSCGPAPTTLGDCCQGPDGRPDVCLGGITAAMCASLGTATTVPNSRCNPDGNCGP